MEKVYNNEDLDGVLNRFIDPKNRENKTSDKKILLIIDNVDKYPKEDENFKKIRDGR